MNQNACRLLLSRRYDNSLNVLELNRKITHIVPRWHKIRVFRENLKLDHSQRSGSLRIIQDIYEPKNYGAIT